MCSSVIRSTNLQFQYKFCILTIKCVNSVEYYAHNLDFRLLSLCFLLPAKTAGVYVRCDNKVVLLKL